MDKITQIIFLILLLIVLSWFFNRKYKNVSSETVNKEGFRVNSQNWVDNNAFDVADRMDYGKNDDVRGMYGSEPVNPMGPSQDIGVNQNSAQDVFDNK
jgi:hypothetical protein